VIFENPAGVLEVVLWAAIGAAKTSLQKK